MQVMAGIQDAPPPVGAGRRRMMVLRAFLAQNVAIGCTFGGFGVSVLSLQRRYEASLGMTSLCLALSVLMLGLAGPLVATLIGRIGLRWTMMLGAIISASGYALLSVAPNMSMVLLIYALPIGIGLAMFGPFPASVLASNWYPHNPGPALGIANVPLFVALIPMGGQVVIRDHGLPTFCLLLAVVHLAILPFLMGIVDRPDAEAGVEEDGAESRFAPSMLTTREILSRPIFWVIVLGAGFLNAIGITGISHLVALSGERGLEPADSAALLSVMGGAAVIGSLLVGVICGRLGAARTIGLIAATLAASWLAISASSAFLSLAVASLFAGAASAGVFPAVNMLSGGVFGQASLPRVIGLFGFATLPLTFCLPPMAGVLRDATGSYGPVIACIVGGSLGVFLIFLRLGQVARERAMEAGADKAMA